MEAEDWSSLKFNGKYVGKKGKQGGCKFPKGSVNKLGNKHWGECLFTRK